MRCEPGQIHNEFQICLALRYPGQDTLLALHQETSAFMMVPTEDAPEKVRRKHATLRPPHLSARLVPNALLKARP